MITQATLIKKTYTKDAIGNEIASESRRNILCEQNSIARQEWSAAGRQGLNPAVVLRTPKINYDGEDTVKFNNKVYAVYRTYETDDDIELYMEEKAGVK